MNVEQFLTKPYHPLDLLDRIAAELSPGHGPEPTERPSTVADASSGEAVHAHSEATAPHTLVKSPILD